MRIEELRELHRYGRWANDRLLAVVSSVTPEQFVLPVGGRHASVRDLIVHMASARRRWLGRCGAMELAPALDPAGFTTVASAADVLAKAEAASEEFLGRLSDDGLARAVEFSSADGRKLFLTVGVLMQQPAIHDAHHRGQVALMLQELGIDPGNIDFAIYEAERLGVSEEELRSML